jgi:Phage tail lysozyme
MMATQQEMMAYAMDELRRQGVPEANLKAAAAHLVGQAQAESGLNPSATHDNGTGYGIYGARLGRADAMQQWLSANGYPRDSAEGQMRYMAREAMSPAYPRTRDVLMNASPDTLAADHTTVTREFERPAVIDDRSKGVLSAYAGGADAPPRAARDPFQAGLSDLDRHLSGLRGKYQPPQQQTGAPDGGSGLSPQQTAMMQLLAKPARAVPQQANYGGIPSPNYAAPGGPSNGVSNMLQLMMQGRQNSNMLALAMGAGNTGGTGASQ